VIAAKDSLAKGTDHRNTLTLAAEEVTRAHEESSLHKTSVQSPCFRRRAATGHHLKERRCRAYQGGSLEQYRGEEERLKRRGHWKLLWGQRLLLREQEGAEGGTDFSSGPATEEGASSPLKGLEGGKEGAKGTTAGADPR
jgi:hypothetical protein